MPTAGRNGATGFRPPEPFTGVAADGVTPLYGMIFRPIGYDPARRYPVIDNVYTGPTTTQTPTSWRDSVSAAGNSVAQIGAVVVMIDGRLDGDVHATERVELAAKARVTGNVHYRTVEMHAGAQLTGRLVHADAAAATATVASLLDGPALVAVSAA